MNVYPKMRLMRMNAPETSKDRNNGISLTTTQVLSQHGACRSPEMGGSKRDLWKLPPNVDDLQ